MPVIDYTTAPAVGKAAAYDGSNVDEIRGFAGGDFLEACGGRVWVRSADGPCELHHGWLVAREEGVTGLLVYAPGAFSRVNVQQSV